MRRRRRSLGDVATCVAPTRLVSLTQEAVTRHQELRRSREHRAVFHLWERRESRQGFTRGIGAHGRDNIACQDLSARARPVVHR